MSSTPAPKRLGSHPFGSDREDVAGVKFSRWDTRVGGGSTFITCAWHQGCPASFAGPFGMNTQGARKEARTEGWLVAQEGGVHVGGSRFARLDYCPEHADKERARRGLRPAR